MCKTRGAFGEFSLTTKFTRHGGKMQKELEQKKKEAEIAAAQAAKAPAADAKGAKKASLAPFASLR